MLFFTWNIHKSDRAFRLALEHLASLTGDVVATFQELPTTAASTMKANKLATSITKSAITCLGVVGTRRAPGRIGLFSSRTVSAVGAVTTDDNRRLAMTVLKSKTWSRLSVVAYHAVDPHNVAREFARGAHAVLTRQQIEAFWEPKRPLVMMGDFNADPYHPEVSSRLGIFAVRDRKEVNRTWESSALAGPMRPLYNPMWHLLPEDSSRPGGTFRLNSEDQGISWRLCDHLPVQLAVKM